MIPPGLKGWPIALPRARDGDHAAPFLLSQGGKRIGFSVPGAGLRIFAGVGGPAAPVTVNLSQSDAPPA